MRFPTFDSFLNFQKALAEDDLELANIKFKEASIEAPFNAKIKLNWGDRNELNDRYPTALLIYIEVAMMWPHLLVIWYRIAIVLYCYWKWNSKLKLNNAENKETATKTVDQHVGFPTQVDQTHGNHKQSC